MHNNNNTIIDPSLEYKKYTYPSGAVYEGTFKGPKRHGHGYWRHPQGEIYEGEYIDNKQQGYGIYLFTTGKRYMGQWEASEMNGRGVYYFAPGDMTYYAGRYRNDKKHGYGFYLYENGIMTVQEWDNGNMLSETDASPKDRVECARYISEILLQIKKVAPNEVPGFPKGLTEKAKTFQFPSGAVYTGQYYNTKKWGRGHWIHPEGDRYIGEFEDNKHVGWGVYIIGRSGKKYIGQWADGKMNGWGVYFFTPSETEFFIGEYKDDSKDGIGMYHFAESGSNKIQTWADGELRKEIDGDEDSIQGFIGALRVIIEIMSEVGPEYRSILDLDKLEGSSCKSI